MILIISSPDDAHIPFVTKHLKDEYIVLDPSMILGGKGLTYEFRPELRVIYNGKPLQNVKSVWLRKPNEVRSHLKLNVQPDYIEYAKDALQRHFNQLQVVFNDALWISDSYAVRRASNKAFQLLVAHEVGFKVPQTIFTSDGNIARAFVKKHETTIVKGISPIWPIVKGKRNAFFTRLISRDEPIKFDGLNVAPAIFQQAIKPIFDIRVTVVDNQVYAAKVVLKEAKEKNVLDWRIGHAKDKGRLFFDAYALPQEVAEKCVELTKRLGLKFGAFDLIYSKDGIWFLEINPNGQWAFIEQATGQPIGKAIAALLEHNLH